MEDLNQPEWPEILRQVQELVIGRINTALPGIVRSYAVASQTATIQLAVQVKGNTVPQLEDVPVVWPGGAAGHLHVPLTAGDSVLVVFSDEDPSKWLTSGSVSAPAVLARHGLHAVAIPGLRHAGAAFPVTGGHVTLAATSELHLGSDTATAFVALATLVDAQLAALKAAITSAAATETTNLGLGGTAALATALAAWPLGAGTAATKVKAV